MADIQVTSLDQITPGIFVKFVDRDKNGRFSYTGEVSSVTKGVAKIVGRDKNTVMEGASFEMVAIEGHMGFNMEDPEVNELYITTVKPTGWAKFRKNPDKFIKAKEEREAVVLPTKTKRELVSELVVANPRKKESVLLKLAKKEIGGNETQLSNYIKLALTKK